MSNPTKKQIERAAAAIVGLVPLEYGGRWNQEFINSAKWPTDFNRSERRITRLIARTALMAALKE